MTVGRKVVEMDQLDYRARHDPLGEGNPAVKRFAEQLPDAEGNVGTPHRVFDTVGMLHERGAIHQHAHASAMKFRDAWDRAHLNPLKAADLGRLLGEASHGQLPAAAYAAREEVWRALQHLGGHSSPIGMAAWHVLGFGTTVKEFADAMGLAAGRSMRQETAKGLVIGACYGLDGFYGS